MRPGRRAHHGHPMTTTIESPTAHLPSRPGAGRRTALVLTGVLTCALPALFTVNISRMLLTGVESEHRFHQATGQGLLLFAVWLLPILVLLKAAWSGSRPSSAAGLQHLTLIATGIACAALAPGGGAPFLVGVIAVGGALLWWALPQRPLLRARIQVDALLAPLALLATAWFVPYAIDQLRQQNAVTGGDHLQNPHLFDMAWLVSVLMVYLLLAALLPAARHLALWTAVACLALGAAGLAFGQPTTFCAVTLLLGAAVGAARLASARRVA
jgi:hypothetical protein